MARVLADNASLFDVTGITEGNAGIRTDSRSIIQGPTVITRAMPLVIRLNDPGASGTLRIYNVRGQLVSDLGSQTGDATVSWSPVDESGSRVPSGTYFVRYEGNATSASHKFLIAE